MSVDPVEGGVTNAYDYPADPINKFDLSGKTVCSGDGDVGCNIGMNVGSIFVGIGDAVTFCPLCLLAGQATLTGLIRNAIGGDYAAEAASEIQSNGFYAFGSIWAGAAAGAAGVGTAGLRAATISVGSRSLPVTTKLGTRLWNSSLTGPKSPLFKRDGGVLNKGPIRIGWNWFGSRTNGTNVFRVGIGPAKTTHINIGTFREF